MTELLFQIQELARFYQSPSCPDRHGMTKANIAWEAYEAVRDLRNRRDATERELWPEWMRAGIGDPRCGDCAGGPCYQEDYQGDPERCGVYEADSDPMPKSAAEEQAWDDIMAAGYDADQAGVMPL
jgi:hypothetical protein